MEIVNIYSEDKLMDDIYKNSIQYADTSLHMSKKTIGQFFTPLSIANYMSDMSTIKNESISILDAGAGSGILSVSLVCKLVRDGVKKIDLVLYEIDQRIIELLDYNMVLLRDYCLSKDVNLKYFINNDNFILTNKDAWKGDISGYFDIVIGNPPYMKIGKGSQESIVMSNVVSGQPNLYFLFMALSAKLLKEGGELIYIVPRSFTSGLYFKKFRRWFLNVMSITNLHLFESRNNVFQDANILQETIIIRAIKEKRNDMISITSSDCSVHNEISIVKVDREVCISKDENNYIFIPTSDLEVDIIKTVSSFKNVLQDFGLVAKTGIVVPFRNVAYMSNDIGDNTIPMLWSYNIYNNDIKFPLHIESKPQYLYDNNDSKKYRMILGNYLLMKRMTAKEEKRRLQCAVLEKQYFKDAHYFTTENHINYITRINGNLSKSEVYGLFVWFNTSIMDKYFRLLNGSTQVNSSELNSIPIPDYDFLIDMGEKAAAAPYLYRDESSCDKLFFSALSRRKTA